MFNNKKSNNKINENTKNIITTNNRLIIFRMGLFGAAHRWEWGKKATVPKICHTNPTIMKLDTVIPYLKKTQKI